MIAAALLHRREALRLGVTCLASMPVWGALSAVRLEGPNDLTGLWHYRSFRNRTDVIPDANKLLFGEGDLSLTESQIGNLGGAGDFGDGDTMSYVGVVSRGTGVTVRFQGRGTGKGNSDWLYDYWGVLVPEWPNGVNQVTAIVGSVVRSAPHGDGSGGVALPGLVASFIVLKK
jgi:hypothetical protein